MLRPSGLRPVPQQLEAVPGHPQQALLPHLAQLVGHGAAVHVEVAGQLLAVEGDGEAPAPAAGRLVGQIGQQPPPDGLGGGVKDLPGQLQIFPGREGKQIADQPGVAGARLGADRKDAVHPQEQDLRGLGRRHADHHRLLRHTGVGLREDLPRARAAQNGGAAPEVQVFDQDAA